MPEKIELKVMGRVLGTCSGWDEGDTMAYNFYDFIPKDGLDLPCGDLWLDFEAGNISVQKQDNGETLFSSDIIDILKNLKREDDSVV